MSWPSHHPRTRPSSSDLQPTSNVDLHNLTCRTRTVQKLNLKAGAHLVLLWRWWKPNGFFWYKEVWGSKGRRTESLAGSRCYPGDGLVSSSWSVRTIFRRQTHRRPVSSTNENTTLQKPIHVKSISKIRSVTCHMRSDSVTCHTMQVNAPV